MKNLARLLLLLWACLLAGSAAAQYPPPPPPGDERAWPRGGREFAPQDADAWREARRSRREMWQQMSPEERHQLRRDIRDAGRELYRRGPMHRNGPRD